MSEFDCTPVEVSCEDRNGQEWRVACVRKASDGNKVRLTFRDVGDVGKGTFGTVQKIVTVEGSTYALKKLEHDPRCYRNFLLLLLHRERLRREALNVLIVCTGIRIGKWRLCAESSTATVVASSIIFRRESNRAAPSSGSTSSWSSCPIVWPAFYRKNDA